MNWFVDSYADNSVCDWRSGVAVIIIAALFYLGCCACAHVGLWLGEMMGWPTVGGLIGVGSPIWAVLINGWIDMWQDSRK